MLTRAGAQEVIVGGRWVTRFGVLGLVAGMLVATTAAPASADPHAVAVDTTSDLALAVDLAAGTVTSFIGALGFDEVGAATFGPDGTLYGVDEALDQLITISLRTGAGTALPNPLGVDVTGAGLAFTCTGELLLSNDSPGHLYRVDPVGGAATLIGAQGQAVTALAVRHGTVYGLGGDGAANLVTINPATGAATPVGNLGTVNPLDGGLETASDGTLWGIDPGSDHTFTVDPSTGAATIQGMLGGTTTMEGLALPTTGDCPAQAPAHVTAFSVRSDVDGLLYRIDLTSGTSTFVGLPGFTSVEGLAFHPGDGRLFAVDDTENRLLTINPQTGAGANVGLFGVDIEEPGLAIDCSGRVWMSALEFPGAIENLYELDPVTGAATLVGPLGQSVTGLTSRSGLLYGLGQTPDDNLVTIDTATGAATVIGPLQNERVAGGGLEFDGNGQLWGLADEAGPRIFTIDPATGRATPRAQVTFGFESLAIPGTTGCPAPPPGPPGPEPLTVDAVDPDALEQGASGVTLVVSGAGFSGSMTADLGPGIDVTAVRVVDTTMLEVDVDVADDAPVGPVDLTIHRGVNSATCDDCLEVVAAPGPTPPDVLGGPADPVAMAIAWSQHVLPGGGARGGSALADTALLGRDDVFADSLASGGLQGARGAPLLLTDPDALDSRTAAELQRLGVGEVVVLGGEAAVSEAIVDELIADGLEVTRLAGASRLETAAAVAEATDPAARFVVLTRAFGEAADATQAFADALAAGGLAAALAAPVLLTETEQLSDAAADFLEGAGTTDVLIAGGELAVGQQVVADLEALGITVERAAGANRFASAVALAGELGYDSAADAPGVILVDGQRADAWADGFAAALSASTGDARPIVLSNGDTVPTETEAFLAAGHVPLTCGASVSPDACTAAQEDLDTGAG